MTSQSIEEAVKFLNSKTQENCKIDRIMQLSWNPEAGEAIASYVHSQTAAGSGLGKIGSVIGLTRTDATGGDALSTYCS